MMIPLYLLTIVLLGVYASLLAYYHKSYTQMPEENRLPASFIPATKLCVIVPARNEEANIETCIRSILAQDYPPHLLQCIIIDDHSEDRTAAIVQRYTWKGIRLLPLKDYMQPGETSAFKKKAIEAGIGQTDAALIVTTDADSVAENQWLRSIAYAHENKKARLIAGPVKIASQRGWLNVFQRLDFLTLQGISAASVFRGFHSMGNGANLAYTKTAFQEVQGFEGIYQLASGDDMLLMHKITRRFPGTTLYLKNRLSIVSTAPAGSLRDFLRQRIRWASKARFYKERSVFWVLLLVYLLNLLLLSILLSGFFSWRNAGYALLFLAIKTGVEWPFLYAITGFFKERSLMKYFPLCQPLHILYTVIAGSFGQFGHYVWKGRRVR